MIFGSADDYEVPEIRCPRCDSKEVLVKEAADGTYFVERCYKCGYVSEKASC